MTSEPAGAPSPSTPPAALLAFLDGVGATQDANTVAIRLQPQPTRSAQAFAEGLRQRVPAEEHWSWSFLTAREPDGTLYGYALPSSNRPSTGAGTVHRVPYVEVHTLVAAWWLTTAWRTRQLVTATTWLTDFSQTVPAAACVRALIETAAAFWVDARKIADAWTDIKQGGPPERDADAHQRRQRLMTVIDEALVGGKFNDHAPDLQALFGRVKRSNVLGSVDKLARILGTGLQEDYQWLCNTVHPSLGNALTFSAPPLTDDTRTHSLTWFSGRPLHITDGSTSHAQRHVQDAGTRCLLPRAAADLRRRTAGRR